MRKPIVSGIYCPFHCSKFEQRQKQLEKCWQKNQELSTENIKMEERIDALNNQINAINYIPLIEEGGHQILGIEQNGTEIVATFMVKFSPHTVWRTIYLCRLPMPEAFEFNHICWIGLRFGDNGTAILDDWHSNIQDNGYGSIAMKHLIRYLQSAGFKRLTGFISHVDYNHLDKLIHFYSKFNFQITQKENRCDLLLDLTSLQQL